MAYGRTALLLAAALLALTPGRLAAAAGERTLIVKFRSEGPAALEVSAEQISRSGRSFASGTRDRSDSLDDLFARYDLGAPRALFPSGKKAETLSERRQALSNRFARRATARSPGRRAVRVELPDLSPIYRVTVPAGSDLHTVLEALAEDPHVEYVQIDHELRLDQLVPPPGFDDPYLTSAGSWGQPYLDLWGLYQARVPEVWSRAQGGEAQGEGSVVAVVDTGLDATHPDIAANVWVNPGEDLDGNDQADASDRNGIDDDQNGFIDDLTGFDFANSVDANEDGDFDDPGDVSDADPTDDNGHGTHVSGTIAAVAGNGIGIAGVAPRARIMALKGFPQSGPANDSVLWRAVLYAAENGATVVNNSWSCSSPCPVNPLAEEVLELVEALGTAVVTSAGNDSTDVAFFSPENGSRVITVGAIGADESLPGFTNRGWLVDLVAPGGGPEEPFSVPVARQNILSLRAAGTRVNEPVFIVDDDYLRLAGTSMSSPHVAGAVAVLRGLRPELEPADIRSLIRLSARDLGSAGDDPEYGTGSLDLAALVDSPLPDFALEIAAPRVGLVRDPSTGPIEIRGTAAGADLAALEIAIARGLSGSEFQPLDSFGTSSFDWDAGSELGEFVARWDVAEVLDGPHVIRVRAQLRDGRPFDEFTIVGIESNSPTHISRGSLATANPDLSGRSLVWQVDEDTESPQTHDLVLGRFPDPRIPWPTLERVLEREGDQLAAVRDGAELAWLEPVGSASRVALWCRIQGHKICEPSLVSSAAGSFGSLQLAGGWLVWSRTDSGQRFIEGCPLSRWQKDCVPRPLVDPATGADWILQSFDGESLLVSRPGRFARCRLGTGATLCLPEEIHLADGETPSEPQHDGNLMAFSRVDIESARPPGCGASDPRPSCARQLIAVVEYLACAIDPKTSFCDPVVVSDKQPVERAFGFDVSGRRVVWSMGSADEQPAVRFCEFEPSLRECRAQRVGGALAAQSEVAIDDNRLVWSDGRDGEVAVFGITIPDLQGPAAHALAPGCDFTILLNADAGSSSTLRYEVEGLAGVTPAEAGARIVDRGMPGGRVLLEGRAPRGVAGRARWRVRAVGGGGFSSDHVIELLIRPRAHPKG